MGEVTAQQAEVLAAGELTPVQRAMTNARYEVLSHEADWVKAGGTKDQVKNASVVASDRAKAEFEAKEKEDPIRRVVEVLHTAAITPEEKLYASSMEKVLESQRAELAKVFNNEQSKAQKADCEPDYPTAIENAIAMNTTNVLSKLTGAPGATFSLLDSWIPNPDSVDAIKNRLVLPVDYEVKVLQALTTLTKDEGIEGIENYPLATNPPTDGTAYYSRLGEHGGNLPTNIDGVKVNVFMSQHPGVDMKVDDISVMKKIAEFPTSV